MVVVFTAACYVNTIVTGNPGEDPEGLCLDGRFNHHLQLQNRLDFIRWDSPRTVEIHTTIFGLCVYHFGMN